MKFTTRYNTSLAKKKIVHKNRRPKVLLPILALLFLSSFRRNTNGEVPVILNVVQPAFSKNQPFHSKEDKILPEKDYQGLLRLAVLPFTYEGVQPHLGVGIYDTFLNMLIDRKRFHLVDRSLLESALRELHISTTALGQNKKLRQIARVLVAEAVLIGRVVEREKSIQIIIRVVDTETLEILSSAKVESRGKESRDIQNSARLLLEKILKKFPLLSGRVIQVTNKRVLIDLGRSDGVQVNMRFLLFSNVPAKGSPGERKRVKTGEMRITQIQNNFSAGEIISGSNNPLKLAYVLAK